MTFPFGSAVILKYFASLFWCKFALFSPGSSALLLEGKVGQEGVKWSSPAACGVSLSLQFQACALPM